MSLLSSEFGGILSLLELTDNIILWGDVVFVEEYLRKHNQSDDFNFNELKNEMHLPHRNLLLRNEIFPNLVDFFLEYISLKYNRGNVEKIIGKEIPLKDCNLDTYICEAASSLKRWNMNQNDLSPYETIIYLEACKRAELEISTRIKYCILGLRILNT